MNVYEKLKNPLDDEEKLAELLEMYSEMIAGSFYGKIVSGDGDLEYDKAWMQFNGLLSRCYDEYLENTDEDYAKLDKHDRSDRLNKAYRKFRKVSSKVFTEDEEEAMIEKLPKSDAESYKLGKKLFEQFDKGSDTMGFHVNPKTLGKADHREQSQVKFYINAGYDTYKFAVLFKKMCEQKNIDYYFKVANPDRGEYNRTDKMCVYVQYEHADEIFNILQELKGNNPDMDFREPPITTASYDGWLGVGTDPQKGSSNEQRADIIEESIKTVFQGVNRKKIAEYAKRHPEKLTELRAAIEEKSKQFDIDPEKFGISKKTGEVLKKIEVKEKEEKSTEEIQEDKTKNTEREIPKKDINESVAEKKPQAGENSKDNRTHVEDNVAEDVSENQNEIDTNPKEKKSLFKRVSDWFKNKFNKKQKSLPEGEEEATSKKAEEEKKEEDGEKAEKKKEKQDREKPEKKKKEQDEEKSKKEEPQLENQYKNIENELIELSRKMAEDYKNHDYKSEEANRAEYEKILSKLCDLKMKNSGKELSKAQIMLEKRQIDFICTNLVFDMRDIISNNIDDEKLKNEKLEQSLNEIRKYCEEDRKPLSDREKFLKSLNTMKIDSSSLNKSAKEEKFPSNKYSEGRDDR